MNEQRLIFYIDAYTPETIPMATLAAYMADFAELLGREHAVHFDRLDRGSTKIAARVEVEDVPKGAARLAEVRQGEFTKDIAKIFNRIDERLANDNAIGRVYVDGEENVPDGVLTFPGRNRPKAQSYGPFWQEGHLDGILIAIGGKDDSIPLRLQSGETVYSRCDTTRAIAREMAKHLVEPVRIQGMGRWTRETSGKWTLLQFKVQGFTVLENNSLRDAVTALRAVRGSGWKEFDDPLKELADMRRDDDELH